MPVKTSAIWRALGERFGPLDYNGLTGIRKGGPKNLTADEYDALEVEYGEIFDAFVENIDWHRVLFEAQVLHYKTLCDDPNHAEGAWQILDLDEGVKDLIPCNRCMKEALKFTRS